MGGGFKIPAKIIHCFFLNLEASEILNQAYTENFSCLVLFRKMKFVSLINYFQAGADANESDQDGDTPLTLAIENNHEAVVKLLLENGANLIK